MSGERKMPHELWRQAGAEFSNCPAARSERYADLMREHGHIVSRRDAVITAAKGALIRRYGGTGDAGREFNAQQIAEVIADDVVAALFGASRG